MSIALARLRSTTPATTLALALLSLSQPAAAQAEASENTQAAGEANAQYSGLTDIIVTARKQAERLQDIPVAVTAIGSQSLVELNITQADKLASLAPNLNIISAAGSTSSATVFIRGVGIFDSGLLTNENPIGIYVDGGYFARLSMALTELVDLERVEVLRGPQGTLFGRNTTGGAIQFFTKGPSVDSGFSQKVGVGSDNEFAST